MIDWKEYQEKAKTPPFKVKVKGNEINLTYFDADLLTEIEKDNLRKDWG